MQALPGIQGSKGAERIGLDACKHEFCPFGKFFGLVFAVSPDFITDLLIPTHRPDMPTARACPERPPAFIPFVGSVGIGGYLAFAFGSRPLRHDSNTSTEMHTQFETSAFHNRRAGIFTQIYISAEGR